MTGSDQETALGIVLIGRNEGERLQRCVKSLANNAANAVYVDSGSTDGSVEFCQNAGLTVVATRHEHPLYSGTSTERRL